MNYDDWKIMGDGKVHHYIVVDYKTPWWLRLLGWPATRKAVYIDGKRVGWERPYDE